MGMGGYGYDQAIERMGEPECVPEADISSFERADSHLIHLA